MNRSLFHTFPLTDLITLMAEIHRPLEPVARSCSNREIDTGAVRRRFPVDLHQTDQNYRLVADLPGIASKDIQVSVDDGCLVIQAERTIERDDNARGVNERFQGQFERRFKLPEDVDLEAIDAKQADGVLTVTVPRTSQNKARRIEVAGA